jgi:hypothetical protein
MQCYQQTSWPTVQLLRAASNRPRCYCFSPVFLIGAESLVSGRRVKGREAITCDAVGALDAAGTIEREEGWLRLFQPVIAV